MNNINDNLLSNILFIYQTKGSAEAYLTFPLSLLFLTNDISTGRFSQINLAADNLTIGYDVSCVNERNVIAVLFVK